MPVPSSITDLSQTAGSNYPGGGESPSTADDYFRAHAGFIAMLRDGKGLSAEVDLASAATCDIGGQNSPFVKVTGTTTITSLGTNYNGPRFIRFADALTLTHNAASLILPGGSNIATAAGDTCVVTPIAGGWVVSQYQRATAPAGLTSGTVQATTSGASKDFTGIPSWAKRITVSYAGISTSGTSSPMVQIGDSGGVEATGYLGTASAASAAAFSIGFLLNVSTTAATVIHGALVLTLIDAATNTWAATGISGQSNSAQVITIAGSKALSGVLDRIRFTIFNGTDTFDAGSVNVLWE